MCMSALHWCRDTQSFATFCLVPSCLQLTAAWCMVEVTSTHYWVPCCCDCLSIMLVLRLPLQACYAVHMHTAALVRHWVGAGLALTRYAGARVLFTMSAIAAMLTERWLCVALLSASAVCFVPRMHCGHLVDNANAAHAWSSLRLQRVRFQSADYNHISLA